MKTRKKVMKSLLVTILLLMGMTMNAQPSNFDCHLDCLERIPDLSEKQKSQVMDLRTDHLKKMQNFWNNINEKQAKLRILETSDTPEKENINKLVEEIGETKMAMHKEKVSHRLEVRNLLSADQKVYFDNATKNGKGNCKSRNANMKPGSGCCPGGRRM